MSDEIYKRDCVNFKRLKEGSCPNTEHGYCINCTNYVSKKMGNVKLQVETNQFFMNCVLSLANAIIDEAMNITYERFHGYPNIQTINYMRMRFKK